MKDRTESGLVRWQVWTYEQFLRQQNNDQTELNPMLDGSGAVWDTLQGILSDLQTLSRGGQIKGSRVLSDNMMVGNMPLKKEYLGHSLLLQQLYIAVMTEKIMNELGHVSANRLSESKEEEERSPSTSSILEGVTTTTTTNTNNPCTTNDNNMLFHDRMDLLEQELYRIKRRAKKKYEEIQLYQDDLTQQLGELSSWKLESGRARKSERVWMLMVFLSVLLGVISLRSLYI
jgi:hypothetical protein